jgi:hypothetical protein
MSSAVTPMSGAAVNRPPAPPSYGPQWVMFFLLLIGGFVFHKVSEHMAFKHVQMVRNYQGQGSTWYMILRMPEIPSAMKDVEKAQRILSARLHVLRREGFTPVLLSDIQRQATKGTPLPSRPVVIVFDPGHRHTFDTLSPVLKEKKVPAVWLTDGEVLDNADRRYVSRHATRLMVKSGLWDVGLYQQGKPLVIENHEIGNWTLSEKSEDVWSASAGVFAINSVDSLKGLSRLNVNSNWTTDEFIDRVLAELPVEGPVRLTARQIRNHLWGLSQALDVPSRPTFTLESNLEKRGNTVSWLGTRGLYDGELTLNVADLSGEAWLLLRSDENLGESVRIGFAEGAAFLEQETDHRSKRLAAAPAEGVGIIGRPFTATVQLNGPQVVLFVNGRKVLTYNDLQLNHSDHGVIRFTVYDKLRGTAQASGVAMTFAPRPAQKQQGASNPS